MLRLGIDLGGTKIEIAAFDENGREALRRRVATPRGDYRATVEAVAALVGGAEIELGERGTLGIGMPGAESRVTGRIKNANSTCLIGQPLKRDLQVLLRREVRLANDANCFALSEAVDGAAAGAEMVFGVILGTGCGGGVVVRGQVLTGANAIAGEWGHNPLPWPADHERPGPACYCGQHGCLETWLSGPGLARDFRAAGGGEPVGPQPSPHGGGRRRRLPGRPGTLRGPSGPWPGPGDQRAGPGRHRPGRRPVEYRPAV
jgi:fructokinase